MLRLIRASVVLIAALAGCRESAVSPPARFDLSIETDRLEYSLGADSFAYVTLTNMSDRPVYLPMDSYIVYERLVDGTWRDPFAWFVVDGVGRSFALEPGEAHTDELQMWFYLRNRPGTYRFRYFVYADAEVNALLPTDERVSGAFTVAP